MRTLALVTALATLGTAALAQRPAAPVQAPQTAQPVVVQGVPLSPQAMHVGALAGGGLALFLSTNPAALNLTSAQLTRIQAAHERTVQANAALRQQIQTATANRDLATLGLAERHALMVRVRGLRQQMQDNVDSATTVAIATLNTEQQRTLLALHQMRGGMGGGMRGGMMGGRGMRGGMMGGRGTRGGMMGGRGMRGGMGGGMRGGSMQGGMGPGMMQGMPMPGMMGPAQAPAAPTTQRPPQ